MYSKEICFSEILPFLKYIPFASLPLYQKNFSQSSESSRTKKVLHTKYQLNKERSCSSEMCFHFGDKIQTKHNTFYSNLTLSFGF